jgi:acetylornithine/N-succinyldiaminopimelate aminotransferase
VSAKTNGEVVARGGRVLLGNYKQQPVVVDRGAGAEVWDVEGRRYLDLICGVATCALGHCHPALTAALHAQVDRLWHVANGVWNEPQVELAEQLTRLSGLSRAFFCNSGAEANEALLKLARRYHKEKGEPDRVEFIAFDNSFHGRTLATLTATGQPKYQKGFEPLPAGFLHVPYGDLDAVRKVAGPRTAGILVEPIQGEGGIRPAPPGFLQGLRELCDRTGALLLLDEIQTGMGRTGRFFAFEHEAIRPDALSMAKALGNGIPIGAMLCREELQSSLSPGTHGSTFGGNPLACAAANAAVRIISAPDTLQKVETLGARLKVGARKLADKHPGRVTDVRGRGLLLGVEVASEAARVMSRCREGGLLVNLAGERTIRFAPPFVATPAQLDEGLAILDQALAGE